MVTKTKQGATKQASQRSAVEIGEQTLDAAVGGLKSNIQSKNQGTTNGIVGKIG